MAVAVILDFPGGTMEQYRQVLAMMELDGRLPTGALFHAAGPYEGGLRVIDTWEDLARFEQFSAEKIAPMAAKAGLQRPAVQVIEVREEKPGSGATPVLVQVVRLPGLDADSFRAMDDRVLPDGKPPEALTFHVNGPIDGGWCVIDAWDSKEERDRFIEARIRPAVGGAPLTGPPEIEDLAVEATLGGRAPTAA